MTNSISKNRLRECVPSTWGEFDSLLKEVLHPRTFTGLRVPYAPASLWEEEGAYHVELDVPGIPRGDIELTFEKGTLTITAERKKPEAERTGWHEERAYGKITRSLKLPETIDPESIEATVADGVLHVTVAKTPEAQPKRIDVK